MENDGREVAKILIYRISPWRETYEILSMRELRLDKLRGALV